VVNGGHGTTGISKAKVDQGQILKQEGIGRDMFKSVFNKFRGTKEQK